MGLPETQKTSVGVPRLLRVKEETAVQTGVVEPVVGGSGVDPPFTPDLPGEDSSPESGRTLTTYPDPEGVSSASRRRKSVADGVFQAFDMRRELSDDHSRGGTGRTETILVDPSRDGRSVGVRTEGTSGR